MNLCLSMIVKNEAKVIERCLASVLPFISSWAIVDTGSTDGTQDIIRKYLGHLPGELHERKWRDFSTNRNQALHIAKLFGDYALIIDADEELVGKIESENLEEMGYYINTKFNDLVYKRVSLIRLTNSWQWVGVLHEVLVHSSFQTKETLENVHILVHTDGARSSQDQRTKFLQDSQVLLVELMKDPTNARNQFYYAQSLRDAGELESAVKAYQNRITMGGWDQELYIAHLEKAKLLERLEKPFESVVAAYLIAYENRSSRAEALYELARYCRLKRMYNLGFIFSSYYKCTTNDILFVDQSVYNWRLEDERAVCAYWIGEYVLSETICMRLLANKHLPETERARIEANLEFARSKRREASWK